jgi:hypothetical protein
MPISADLSALKPDFNNNYYNNLTISHFKLINYFLNFKNVCCQPAVKPEQPKRSLQANITL